MIRYYIVIALLTFFSAQNFAQLRVSPDQRHLQTSHGKAFFWLGDTAWELFHRLDRKDAEQYLSDRASKGFTVIQAVILAELDGLNTPNANGHTPLADNDPTKPDDEYFKHVDAIVKFAEKQGLVMALLPSWGDKWNKAWGVGPEIFTPENAFVFGEFLGRRYRNNDVVWIVGGDRHLENEEDREIIEAMASGLRKGDGGKHLISFHPTGARTSSEYFQDVAWIDFHMSQTGHTSKSKPYQFNRKNRAIQPIKPYLDAEPRYEDHPNQFDPVKYGWMDDFDARQCAYWSMLSGAFGHTYGNHNIWQFYEEGRQPISSARTHWNAALNHPGAVQMGIMKRLFEEHEWQKLVPDQSILPGNNPENESYMISAISSENDLLMAYIPYGNQVDLKTDKLSGMQLQARLFNPRDGYSIDLGTFPNRGMKSIEPPSKGRGSDWLVIIENDEAVSLSSK